MTVGGRMNRTGIFRTLLAVLIAIIMCSTPGMALFVGNLQAPMRVDDEIASEDLGPMSVRGSLAHTRDVDSTALNNQRKLVRDFNDILHAVFTKSGEVHYTSSNDDGISWLGSIDLSGGATEAKYPSLALDGNHIYVVWEDGANISFRRTFDLGATWVPPLAQSPMILTSNAVNRPKSPVVAGDNTNLVVAWSGYHGPSTNYEIKYVRSTDNGTSFSAETAMTSTGALSHRPCLWANNTDYYLIYQEGDIGSRDIMFHSSADSGSSWSVAIDVSNDGGDSMSPSMLVNGTNIYVTWVDKSAGNPTEVVFKRSTDSGQAWLNTFIVSENPSRSFAPCVIDGGYGDIYIVWVDQFHRESGQLHIFNNTLIRKWNHTSGLMDPMVWATDNDEGNHYPAVNPIGIKNRIEWIYGFARQPNYNVKYGWHFIGANKAPTLTWTGETNYENTGLFPETGGTTAHTFTFRINYTDEDNNEPLGDVFVLVDHDQDGRFNYLDNKEKRKMSEAQPWDDDYTDGKFYTHSMKFPGIGTDYKYRFHVRDCMNNLGVGVGVYEKGYPDINIVNNEPRLFWTNEKGYSSDGVEPSSGTSSTNFTWHVSYFDEDNNPPMPGYPMVLIDIDNNTIYSSHERFNMTELDPDDAAYDDGKFYSFSRTLPNVGTYLYRFIARDNYDIGNPATDKPSVSTTGPTVTTINTPPIVTFLDETGFSDDGLDPNSGSTSRLFRFRINYTDAENNPPLDKYPKVDIDLDLDNVFSAGEKFTMLEENASDNDHTDGKMYYYEVFYPTVGQYTYRFEARDIHGQQATGGSMALMDGPDITKENDAPTLEYPDIDGFDIDGVNPDMGRTTTRFTYSVIYSDINDDPPLTGYPRVWVDVDVDGTFSLGEVFVLNPVDPLDLVFEDGKIYSTSVFINKTGRSQYMFEAWDGFDGYATGGATKTVGGPDIGTNYNNAPILDWVGEPGYEHDGIHPDSGPNTETFMYKVLYTDHDNDEPDTNYPKLYFDFSGNGDFNGSNERQSLYEEDGDDQDFTDGKVYYFETDLSTSFTQMGTGYTYTFFGQDSRQTAGVGPATSIMHGPNITAGNSPPELVWPGDMNYEGDGLHPESGNSSMEFVFRVMYLDVDDDPPSAGNPKIYIDLDPMGKTMEKEDPTDDDHTDGVVYVHKSTLALGSHTYRFLAFDQFGTKAKTSGAPLQTKDGPLVEENEAPVLTWPTGDYTNGLDKVKGEVGTIFTFKVTYSDAEGDRPATGYPRLQIDRNGDGDFSDPLESMEMVRGAGSDKGGVDYTLALVLEKGAHTYKFVAKDIKGNMATGEPTVAQEAGVKVTAPQVAGESDMTMTLILVVMIVVALVIGLVIGKKMGGGKAAKAQEPEPQQLAQPDQQQQAYYHEGYGYMQDGYAEDPSQQGYPPQEQVPEPEPAPVQEQPTPPPQAPPPQPPPKPVEKPPQTAPQPPPKPVETPPKTAPKPPQKEG